MYTFRKLLNQKNLKRLKILFSFFLSLGLSVCAYLFKLYLPYFGDIFSVIVLWLSLYSRCFRPQTSFVATVISFGFSYVMFVISSCIILILFTPILYRCTSFPYYFFMLFSGILECVLILTLFRQKRLRKGMPFLYSTTFVNIGTLICLLILTLLTSMQVPRSPQLWFAVSAPATFIVALIVLMHWWQTQLNKNYLAKLQKLELESLRNELQEKTKALSDLRKEHEELCKLIHQDNKLIPAMENAVFEYLVSQKINCTDTLSRGNNLLVELRNLSENRKDVLSAISTLHSRMFSTGNSSLDALLSYMDKQTSIHNIDFSVNILVDFKFLIPSIISSDDLIHLLADLIENALIATSNCVHRKIQLQIYMSNKSLIIELSDTGIPFEITSFLHLGYEQITTHAESGGSGIGLMNIWEIKNKYKASIHIMEYKEPSPFSKKILFLLDNKNQYLLYSWRYKEIISQLTRTDLYVLPNTDA